MTGSGNEKGDGDSTYLLAGNMTFPSADELTR